MRLVPLGTIRIPRLRRGRRPRRPASFVLGSKNTDRHTSVATLVCDDRPSACALRACGPAGEGLASPTACSSPSGGGCRLRQVRERVSRPPVGAIHESLRRPCTRVRQAGRRGRRPLRRRRTFSSNSEFRIHLPPLRQLRQLRRLFPRRKLSQAVTGRRTRAHL